MSYIRRADGTVVYGGKHTGSRGSLSDVYNGSASNDDYFDQAIEAEDREWERRVLASAVTMYDSVSYDYDNYDDDDDYYDQNIYSHGSCNIGSVKSLWGIYKREMCPFIKIGFEEDINGKTKGCFRRSER